MWTQGSHMDGISETAQMEAVTKDSSGKNKPVLREKRPMASRSMSTASMESGRSAASSNAVHRR